MRALLTIGATLVLLTGCDQRPVIRGDDTIAIIGGTLIDGTGERPRPDTTVLLVDGRIDRIVSSGSVRLDDSVEVFDATGRWILPGFIDAHAHLPERDRLDGFFSALLAAGITAARCPATTTEYGAEIRDRLDAGELTGPTFRVAGGLIDGTGAWFDYALVVTSEDEMRRAVSAQAETGVDFIKFYTMLSPDLVEAGIAEAQRHGVSTIGHLGKTSWIEAADAGIDALTHSGYLGMVSNLVAEKHRAAFEGFFLPNEYGAFDPSLFATLVSAMADDDAPAHQLGRRLAEAGVVVDPNLVNLDASIRGDDAELYERLVPEALRTDFEPHPGTSWWYEGEREAARAALPLFMDAVRILHEEGVLLAAGTDVSNPWMIPGVSFHRELELLVEAGIAPLDVLTIATRNGAMAMKLEDELGTVEPGKRADLVILDADPLADIRNTERVAAVFQRGRRVDRDR